LTVFSLIFYAWGEPIWVGLLLFSALIDYFNGLFIEYFRGTHTAKWGIVSTIFFNIGLLFTFKYSDFFVDNTNFILGTDFDKPGFLLPIGISFYTFQTISYTIDVYKNEVKAQRSFGDFLLFVCCFHQLVAGPIVRYSHIAKEIEERVFVANDFNEGISRFCKGLFKKVLIANTAGELGASFLNGNTDNLSILGAWLGLFLFSLQIYFDFSGYSDMAIGLGRMFGFHYHENFKHPYLSVSVTDFWRRWHISLGTFFRDYVYIPLGGNRKNQLRNILIVWLLTGFWHGASWNFILWGLYFGFLLLLEKYFLEDFLRAIPVIFRRVYALFFIVVGWGIFYFTDTQKLLEYFAVLFGFSFYPLTDFVAQNAIFENIFWILLAIVFCLPITERFDNFCKKNILSHSGREIIQILLNLFFFFTSVMMLVGSTYNPFLYFRF
jgi:alginate O-acetyltransferase complex protein AlgI